MSRAIPRFTRGVLVASLYLACVLAGSTGQTRKAAVRPIVDMVIERRGTIRIELLPAEAPKTVAHFLELTDKRFYDGILFHRVEAKLVAQAGDPESKKIDGAKIADISPSEVTQKYRLGIGGSGKTVPLEAVAPCMRGSVGLGRNFSPDSGDSQFFFNLSDNHRFDNQYTVFGKVIQGLDVMGAIRQGDRIKSVRRVRQNGVKGR
jgi:cyclophilin family peptidyl-prolyl cis-trans isomerase